MYVRFYSSLNPHQLNNKPKTTIILTARLTFPVPQYDEPSQRALLLDERSSQIHPVAGKGRPIRQDLRLPVQVGQELDH